MASVSNTSSLYAPSCDVASIKCQGKNIVIYEGNQEICYDQGCFVSTSTVAKSLYNTTLAIRNFFWLKFGLLGINKKGEIPPLQIGWDENNAQWICTSSLSQSCFFRFNNRYAVQPKVVAHEYTHGIITRLRPLKYQNQSGALNESLADVFGIVFNYWHKNDTSWEIAGRDLSKHVSAPFDLLPYSKLPAPKNDYGNVHTNSCVPNHAFYMAVQLIGEPRDGKVAQIWFQALLLVDLNETFKLFACRTVMQAQILYDNDVAEAVRNAWVDVGVLSLYIPTPIQQKQYAPKERYRPIKA